MGMDLDQVFAFHPPADNMTVHRHETMRNKAKELAQFIVDNTAPSREQSMALTACQEVMMWGNAAIAIHDVRFTTGQAPAPVVDPALAAEINEAQSGELVPSRSELTGVGQPDEPQTEITADDLAEADLETEPGADEEIVLAGEIGFAVGQEIHVNSRDGDGGNATILEINGDEDVKIRFATGIEATVRVSDISPIVA